MEELAAADGFGCATDRVLYNVTRRGPEPNLLPALAERDMPVMAYSPVERGRLPCGGALQTVADRHAVTPYQVALALAVRGTNVLAIPRASDAAHVHEHRQALDLVLTADDTAKIDMALPPPKRASRPEML